MEGRKIEMFFGEYRRCLDEGGRVCLPLRLRKEFGGKKIVVIGCGNYVEIWSPEKWAEEKRKVKKVLEGEL